MNYKEAVEKLTKYPDNFQETKYVKINNGYPGNHYGRKCRFTCLDFDGANTKVLLLPNGCREAFSQRFFGCVSAFVWDRSISISKKELEKYRSRDFIILHARFYNKTKKFVNQSIKLINEIEESVGIKKTVMISNDAGKYIFISPSEWFYNNVLTSAYLLLIRDCEDKDLPTKENISILLKNKEFIFDKKELFNNSHVGIKQFISGSIMYYTYAEKHTITAARKRYAKKGGSIIIEEPKKPKVNVIEPEDAEW
ncbi:MAG: hypothetical protein WCT16_05120 [Candidatus Buchananbacteria bacterium]|jgi:hypothetical protein